MKPKKSLGQNFLNNSKILIEIVNSGNVSKNDVVLEIGPGTGNLTEKILNKNPKNLIVVEKDKELSILLKKKFGGEIEIINKDILECYNDFNFNFPIKVFGNLPYNISTKILTSWIKIKNLEKLYKKFILVFQKEVAERIIAKENTKNYGRLSIITSWKMEGKKLFDISPDYFFPKPKVWSSLLILEPKEIYKKIYKTENLEHITNIFFNQRRKMIKKPMKQIFKNYEDIAKQLNISLNLRPHNISKDRYLEICQLYEKFNLTNF